VLFAGAIADAEFDTARSPLLWHRRHYHGVGAID
jgi:hypothetical protein